MHQKSQSRSPLRWRWIFSLSLSGLVFGGLSIAGFIHGWEGWIITAILLTCAVLLTIVVDHAPIRHGLATGFLLGLFGVWSQALFMATYLENNPDSAAVEIPFAMSARWFTALFGPLNALLAAAIVAALTWAGFRLRGLLSSRSRGAHDDS